jgi:hypothetical protein
VVVLAAAAAYALLAAERVVWVVAGFGAAAVVVLAVGLLQRLDAAVTAAIAGAGTCWTISAWTRGADAPGGTVLVASALLVAAELAFMSLEQASARDESELVARRLAGVAGRAVGALVLATFLLAALGLHAGGGVVLEAVGVAASVGLLAFVFALARTPVR